MLNASASTLALATALFGRLADPFRVRLPLGLGVGFAVPILGITTISSRHTGRECAIGLGRVAGLTTVAGACGPTARRGDGRRCRLAGRASYFDLKNPGSGGR